MGHACDNGATCYPTGSSCITDLNGASVCECTTPFVKDDNGNCITGEQKVVKISH